MSALTLKNIYAATPATERGRPIVLTADAKGERIIYGCGNTVFIRSLKNPLETDVYTEHNHPVTAARFAPSGFYIASGDAAGNVRIWATDNAEKTLKIELRPVTGPVTDIQWSEDSKRIVAVGDGRESFAHVFLWDSGSKIGEISGHSKKINSVDYRPCRPYRIVTASEDFLVNFFEGPPFKFVQSLRNHTNFANCVRFSPDGSKFVSTGSDYKIFIYDGAKGDLIKELTGGHKGTVYSASWSPDSKQLITASADKSVKLWDVESGQVLNTFTFGTNVFDMQVGCLWTKTAAVSVSLSSDINFLDLENPAKPAKLYEGHNKPISALAYNPDTKLVYTGDNDGVVVAWELGVGNKGKLKGKGHTSTITSIKPGKNGSIVTTSNDDSIRITPSDTLQYASECAKLQGTPSDIAIGRVDKDLSIVVSSKSIAILRNGGIANTMDIKYGAFSVDISNDDSEVLVGGSDKKIHVYSLSGTTLSETKVLDQGHRGAVHAVRYSPDGTRFASGDANREVIVWDSQTKQPVVTELVYHTARITSVSWSPDSSRIVTGSLDSSIIVWNLAEKTRLVAKNAHFGGVTSVAYVDANTVASAGNDCTLKTWSF